MANPQLSLNDGHSIPQLGMGIWQVPDDDAARTVREGIANGYRLIDGAAIYRNERGMGQGIRDSGIARNELFVTSKLWNADQGFDSTLRAFEATMARTGLDYLDLYLIHWPRPAADLYVDTWKAMIRLREDGRIRSIGVSNFNAEHLDRLVAETGVTPVLNQVELHPAMQQKALREVHARMGIVTQSWSPLGRSQMFEDPTVTDIAARLNKSPAQVILRWHVDSGLSVIPKSVRPERQRENFAVLDFALSPEDMLAISALDSETRVGPEPADYNDAPPVDD